MVKNNNIPTTLTVQVRSTWTKSCFTWYRHRRAGISVYQRKERNAAVWQFHDDSLQL